MLEAFSSLFTLRWTNPPIYHPLPDNITRTFITTASKPNDKLELLVSNPPPSSTNHSTTTTSPPPILFIHGGFGSASVYLPFIQHLSPTTQCFSISTRNHGASYTVPYLRMVFSTTVTELCDDIAAAVTHVTNTTGQSPLLVAHSSGGGLAQYLLAKTMTPKPVAGLVLLDAVPHFGNLGVYANWARHDPWFMLRTLLHAYHPISPLSSLNLVRGAFFGPGARGKTSSSALSDDHVRDFMRWMPRYESLMWPMQMAGSFWGWLTGTPRWLDAKDVLARVQLDGVNERVCVMFGDRDVLMDGAMCRRAAREYAAAVRELRSSRDFKGEDLGVDVDVSSNAEETDEKVVGRSDGVRVVVVKGAGHHSQNDVQWQVAAEELRKFVVQL